MTVVLGCLPHVGPTASTPLIRQSQGPPGPHGGTLPPRGPAVTLLGGAHTERPPTLRPVEERTFQEGVGGHPTIEARGSSESPFLCLPLRYANANSQ